MPRLAEKIAASAALLAFGVGGCGAHSGEDPGAAHGGIDGGSGHGASCRGMHGSECQSGDCCARLPVPGGTFAQGEPDAFDSTVSSYLLDEYEVTVGRFRNFIAGYDAWRAAGNPVAGSGSNASVPGSGWDTSYDGFLPATGEALLANAAADCGDAMYQTWAASGNDTLPVNCVDWYTSFAFCIWDGARLPTESEWEYAAASGDGNTLYPWGNTPIPDNTLGTAALAAYNCMGDGNLDCTFGDILPVGSRPVGNGRFGQSDLAGSMWEWNLDWFAFYPPAAQTNYANVAEGSTRVIRGGDWSSNAATLLAAARYSYGFPSAHFTNVGFRCAATP
jgi:sulfatase modifying factor 1